VAEAGVYAGPQAVAGGQLGQQLALLTSALDATLPIGRFGGLIWIIAVSVLLPASRHRLPAAAGKPAAAAA
jgi:hypothetical protein